MRRYRYEPLTQEIATIMHSDELAEALEEKNATLAERDLGKELVYAETDPQKKRELGFAQLDASTRFIKAITAFNDIQNVLSRMVYEAEEKRTARDIANGVYREYTGERLGNAVKTAHFPSGSAEWLAQRKKGIGGSDVPIILGLNPYQGYRDLLRDKVTPVTEEQLDSQNVENTAAWRGDNWEEALVRQFATVHADEFETIHCKDSWASRENEHFLANADGLIAVDGKIDGVLEIKTSSRPSEWEDGAPLKYLAQAMWYMLVFGFHFGVIAVLIDSSDYREYDFDDTTTIPVKENGEIVHLGIDGIRERVLRFLSHVDQVKGLMAQGYTVDQAINKVVPPKYGRLGTPRSVTPTRQKHYLAVTQREELPVTVERLMEGYYNNDPETWSKNIVSVDLETTAFSPLSGYIIEFGAVEYDRNGTKVGKMDELFDIPADRRGILGTGNSDVHHISLADIEGKPLFRDESERIMDFLRGKVLLAHNARFEVSWLTQHLDGFVEAEIPVIDTMVLSGMFLPDAGDTTLKIMCEKLGVPYTNGHRAYHDAEVAGDAFFALLRHLRKAK